MKLIKKIAFLLIGVALLFITSQISIPLKPIPLTLQTVGVMLIGLAYTRSLAVLTVLLYLVLGGLGLPMFANLRGGWTALLGPSGGYLWGFLAAVIIMTTMKQYLNGLSFVKITCNCLLGTLVILLFGAIWLSFFIGFEAAVSSGFYLFIAPGIIKALFASTIYYLYVKINEL